MKGLSMKRLALLVVLAVGGLLLLAGPASAHVTVSSTNATPGGYATVVLNVPTESDTASTTKLVVRLPTVGSVSVQATPGWRFAAKKTKLVDRLLSSPAFARSPRRSRRSPGRRRAVASSRDSSSSSS